MRSVMVLLVVATACSASPSLTPRTAVGCSTVRPGTAAITVEWSARLGETDVELTPFARGFERQDYATFLGSSLSVRGSAMLVFSDTSRGADSLPAYSLTSSNWQSAGDTLRVTFDGLEEAINYSWRLRTKRNGQTTVGPIIVATAPSCPGPHAHP